MRFFNIDVRGKFITQRLSSVPTVAEKGRIIFSEADDKMYFGNGSGEFKSFSDFDSGTIMLFGNSSAPVGWTRKSDWQNNAMFTFKATGAVSNGGSVDPRSTHTHTGPSHTHSMQNHRHATSGHALTEAEMPAHSHTYAVQTFSASGEYWWSVNLLNNGCACASYSGSPTGYPSTVAVGSSNSHSHGNTGTPDSNTTTPAGTGDTGANTAPYYQEIIAASKD
jgi:hypothetical protein